MKIIPVVLCGGAGSRLWPVSRESYPKPFLKIGEKSLLQQAIERGQACGADELLVVANQDHFFLVKDVIARMENQPQCDYILEPRARNTAPAITLAALHIAERYGPDSVMLVLPADHLIPETSAFVANALEAAAQAQHGYLVAFGIKPTSPETGFGYIKVADTSLKTQRAVEFVEKPNFEKAVEYLASGLYYWNSGMVCFTAKSYLAAVEICSPEVLKAAHNAKAQSNSVNFDQGLRTITRFEEHSFCNQPNISNDYAVMERSRNVMIVPAKFSWSDVGIWSAVADAVVPDANGNTLTADDHIDWVSISTKNTHIHIDTQGPKAVIATVGVNDLIIVHTPDAILVMHKSFGQDVKKVVSRLRERHNSSAQFQSTVLPTTVSRPWGTYTTLKEEQGYKVKRITVAPGQRLSLQYHHHRAEHWAVVKGRALVQVDNEEFDLSVGQHKYIPLGAIHRLTNQGPQELVLIEVQIGSYLGEDDIVRIDDVYGRTSVL